jgi:hypothetical protein
MPNREEIMEAWCAGVLRAVAEDINRSTAGKKISTDDLYASKRFDGKSNEQVVREMTASAKKINLANPDKKELAQYKEEILALEGKYEAALAMLPTNQGKYAAKALVWWLLPSAAVLLLGYALAWIQQGFRSTPKKPCG